MKKQQSISYSLNKKLIGKIIKALVIEKRGNDYLLSTQFNGPDDIDGKVTLKTNLTHSVGDIVEVKITNAFVYDLIAQEI